MHGSTTRQTDTNQVRTIDSFADEAFLSLSKHQSIEGIEYVSCQVWGRCNWQCHLCGRHYVSEYTTGLLHTQTHTQQLPTLEARTYVIVLHFPNDISDGLA